MHIAYYSSRKYVMVWHITRKSCPIDFIVMCSQNIWRTCLATHILNCEQHANVLCTLHVFCSSESAPITIKTEVLYNKLKQENPISLTHPVKTPNCRRPRSWSHRRTFAPCTGPCARKWSDAAAPPRRCGDVGSDRVASATRKRRRRSCLCEVALLAIIFMCFACGFFNSLCRSLRVWRRGGLMPTQSSQSQRGCDAQI